MNVKVKKVNPLAIIPKYQTKDAAGFDFHSLITCSVLPGETKKVPTGLSFEIPIGCEIQVRPRSGLSAKTKLRVCNSPGTVDADFRGEVLVLIENIGKEVETICTYDRIAQGVLCPVFQAEFIEVDELSESERGNGGFGSTNEKKS